MDNPIRQLAQLHGIADSYLDYRGQPRQVSIESQAAILAALGADASSADAAAAAMFAFHTRRWTGFLPPVIVSPLNEPIAVPVAVPVELKARSVEWTVTLEGGSQQTGTASLAKLDALETGEVDGRHYRRLALPLPELPQGYHAVAVALDTALNGALRLVVTPDRCFEASAIAAGKKLWGIAVQLYSLRSANNWGVGDFRDLRELIALAAPHGCGIIGLNPLHALMPANPAHISPYSPSNRQ